MLAARCRCSRPGRIWGCSSVAKASVELSTAALADLIAIQDGYAAAGAGDVGPRLVASILARIEALQQHPDLGRVVPEFDSAARFTRAQR